MYDITDCIPPFGKKLAKYETKEIIERLGIDVIRNAVIGILRGENIRSLTENLTKRRIALSSAALLKTYIEACDKIPNFTQNYTSILLNNFNKSKQLSQAEKCYLNWFSGLTDKQIQNVLRDKDKNNLEKYLVEMEKQINSSKNEACKIFGNLSGHLKIANSTINVTWLEIIQLFMAIGSETLAIRGSEKSIYGKLFEKLVLGSVLSILGFEFAQRENTNKTEKIFWLSERGEKRESDATAIIKAGQGIRFDIGFIGVGNPEVSLDKVSRFERNMEFKNYAYNMTTIIIIDRIGEHSRIIEMAKEIDGHIIQMSMSNWIAELSQILYKEYNYKSPLYGLSPEDVIREIPTKMKDVELDKFILNKTISLL